MDKDTFVPQSGGGGHVREGHDESDLSIKGIITFGVVLAVCGILSFALMGGFLKLLPGMQTKVFGEQPQLTPVQRQLRNEREAQRPAQKEAETESRPEWFGRGEMEAHLNKTFPTPRLQYDDVRDMQTFRVSEEEWLATAGKDAQGNVHIPIDRAMDLIAERGLPAVSGPFVPPTLPSAVPLVPAPAAASRK